MFTLARRLLNTRWKTTGLTIDKEILHNALGELRDLISATQVDYIKTKITELTGRKSLFKQFVLVVDSFLLKKPALRLPSHGDLPALLEDFGNFFLKKIQGIRLSLETAGPALDLELPMSSCILAEFTPVTAADVLSLISQIPTKSSPFIPFQHFF
jgi:hypothetical protein